MTVILVPCSIAALLLTNDYSPLEAACLVELWRCDTLQYSVFSSILLIPRFCGHSRNSLKALQWWPSCLQGLASFFEFEQFCTYVQNQKKSLIVYSRRFAANPRRTGDRTERNKNAKQVLDKNTSISDVFSVVFKCQNWAKPLFRQFSLLFLSPVGTSQHFA